MTTASTGCASSSRRFTASPCQRRPAASTARSWSIIDPVKLQAKGLTPHDVVNAINAQNLTCHPAPPRSVTPSTRCAPTRRRVELDDLNNIPVKFQNGATVFVKDVGQVHDGKLVQQNVVRTEGQRSVLLSIIKNGNASTLAVVNAVKDALTPPARRRRRACKIRELFDQSVFVSDSLRSVLREGAIAAGCDRADDRALPRLVALDPGGNDHDPAGDPGSLVVLYFLGDTINTMTLGGLALAIGILVDNSTVTIENTHRLLTEEGMPLPQATLHGAAGIAVPTLVSTLAISCVFVSVVFLHGPAKYCSRRSGWRWCSRCSPPTGCRER